MGRRGRTRGDGDAKADGEEERQTTQDQDQDQDQNSFFACYLLCSLCPRYKSRTYIGFTVNPRRRIRQHNGEIMCGAGRTKKGRPWEMVLCIYGFPSNITALQFEWAWQHPTESLAVRKAASDFKSLRGLANKIKLAYTMLNLPSWENLNLTVNFFSTKYTKFTAGCPKLPNQMKFGICVIDDLPCYSKDYFSNRNNELNNQAQQTAFDSMEEMFSSERSNDGGSSDNNHHCDQFEVENNYKILQELNLASMDDRVKDQSKDDVKAKLDEIASPEGFNEAVSSDTGGGIALPENDVIDLVTPLSCAAKRRGKKSISSMIDLTSSPCVIEL